MIGWVARYAIGIIFSAVLLAIWGLEWARHPTLLPALIVALLSFVGPFFLMQPGMGAPGLRPQGLRSPTPPDCSVLLPTRFSASVSMYPPFSRHC